MFLVAVLYKNLMTEKRLPTLEKRMSSSKVIAPHDRDLTTWLVESRSRPNGWWRATSSPPIKNGACQSRADWQAPSRSARTKAKRRERLAFQSRAELRGPAL